MTRLEDLLRHAGGQLPASQVADLLAPLARIVNEAGGAALDLRTSGVRFSTPEEMPSSRHHSPFGAEWLNGGRAGRLEVAPLDRETFIAETNPSAEVTVTILPDRCAVAGVLPATVALAGLIYELLGGTPPMHGAYRPLAACDEATNAILRHALVGGYADATFLADALGAGLAGRGARQTTSPPVSSKVAPLSVPMMPATVAAMSQPVRSAAPTFPVPPTVPHMFSEAPPRGGRAWLWWTVAIAAIAVCLAWGWVIYQLSHRGAGRAPLSAPVGTPAATSTPAPAPTAESMPPSTPLPTAAATPTPYSTVAPTSTPASTPATPLLETPSPASTPRTPKPTPVPSANNNVAPHEVLVGIGAVELTPALRKQLRIPASVHGVIINQTPATSAGYRAGLRVGDVVVEINDHPINNARDAMALTQRSTSRETVVTVLRPNETVHIAVVEE